MNELPRLDRQNVDIVGRLFAHGGLGHATTGDDRMLLVLTMHTAGRGMLGIIMVRGDVPVEARLDRPAQAQP